MTEEEKRSSAKSGEAGAGAGGPNQAKSEASDSGSSTTDSESLERDLDEARSKANTYLDLAQRTQADFVNYKRRIDQERSDFARGARGDIIARLLGPLDDLDRAVASLPPNLSQNDWAQGIVLIDRKFHSALEALGVREIDVEGKPFDPYQAESIAHEPSDTVPAESVTKVVQPGYAIDSRVIRPAHVVISSGPRQAGSK
jgi:molecular chaperone GrpE